VSIPGVTHVRSADGLFGTLTEVRSDMTEQVTIAEGPVDLTFPDGSHLVAGNMHFDGPADIWTFERATLTVPNLPKAKLSWNNVFLIFTNDEVPQ